jgi:hypothetical protein
MEPIENIRYRPVSAVLCVLIGTVLKTSGVGVISDVQGYGLPVWVFIKGIVGMGTGKVSITH